MANGNHSTYKPGKARKRSRHWLVWIVYLLLLGVFMTVGALVGLYVGYRYDLPEVKSLENYRPDVISEVYAHDNRLIGQFAIQKRIIISYKQIPKRFIEALTAAEDQNFFRHYGVDFQGILRAAYKDIRAMGIVEGGSTLTQQLSKLLFLTPETSWERKVKEAILAIQIEKYYTKEQILTFYCNQIYMGDGTYGIASAALHYFGKDLDQVTLEECAMLAGLLNSPWKFSPVYNMDRALERRNLVLSRMLSEKMITPAEYRAAVESPIVLRPPQRRNESAAYFLEWVRRYLAQKYDTEEIWRKGLKIYTTLDLDQQKLAEEALRAGLRTVDKAKGWRGAPRNLFREGASQMENYSDPDWKVPLEEGHIVNALVMEARPAEARLRLGSLEARLDTKGVEWTGQTVLNRLLRKGDLVPVKIEKLQDGRVTVSLEQHPEMQGSLIALDNATGGIRAMVGGYDFGVSKFNRATQALRQTGSAFKPFVYTAALESGMDPDDTVLDAPISFSDGVGKIWAPENYDGKFKGVISLRQALAESRNVPAVRLGKHVGVTNIIHVARRFGITSPLQPYLPISIGASEVSLLEMTSAISVFPRQGILAKPFFINRVEDYDREERESHGPPRLQEVVRPEIAARMTSLLMGVVLFGTSTRARELERPLIGKTGTTNDSTDAWFIGAIPSMTVGIWVGYDDKAKTLGSKATGGSIALPIWIRYMKDVLQDKPVEPFIFPEGINGPPSAPANWIVRSMAVPPPQPPQAYPPPASSTASTTTIPSSPPTTLPQP